MVAILRGLGEPTTAANVRALQAWAQAEGGNARFNPWNSTEGAPGATNYNSVGVKNYTSEAQGVKASIATLRNGRYGAILQALHEGHNPLAVAHAVGASPWGTSGSLLAQILGGSVHGGSEPAQNLPVGGGVPPRGTQAPPPFHAPVITLPPSTGITPAQALANLLAGDQQQPLQQEAPPLTRQTPSYAGALQALHTGLMRATT